MTKNHTQKKNGTQMSFTPKMTKIVEFLKMADEEFHTKIIAQRLRMNYNTTREYLRRLSNAGYLECRKVDGLNFYQYPIRAKLVKRELPELKFHDIVLRFHHQGEGFYAFQGRWKQDLYLKDAHSPEMATFPHKVVTTHEGRKIGTVSFQQGKENLMVYYGGSGRPLTWEEFMALLRWLGRTFRCDVLNDKRWIVAQIGPGTDFEKTFIEGFGGSVSVHDFTGSVARVYKKELDSGEEVIRTEVHTYPNMTLAAVVESLRGSLSFADSLNLMARQSVLMERLLRKLDTLFSMLKRRNGVD